MADYSDNDLRYYADRLDAVLHQFTGMGTGTTADRSAARSSKSGFHKGLDKATEGLEFMHGSAMQASHTLRNFVGASAISGIVTAVIHSMTDMYTTFSKLTDVGFNFGGSMLEMQKQAADSGLSLDEFARSLGKNSVVVAQMGNAQTQGVKQFADFQKQVRSNLKDFGYYGMTLSQVDDASGEYLDDLRLTGQLTHLTAKEQVSAAKNFITNVNAMAAATGKSREEIIKLTTQALNSEPAAAARLSELGPKVTTAFMTTVATLASSMGDAGPELSKMFAQTFAANGQTWATDLGDTLIKTGLGSVNSMFAQMNDEVASGHADNADIAKQTVAIKEEIGSHLASLRSLRLNPEMRGSVDRVLKLYNDLPANAELIAKKIREAQRIQLDGVTQAAALFETNLHEFTAQFRHGFYQGILDVVAPGKKGAEQMDAFATTIESVKDTMKDFGTTFGVVFGLLIDAITPAAWIFKEAVSVLGFGRTVIENMLKPFGLGAVGGGELKWEQDGDKDATDKDGKRIPIWEIDPKTGEDKLDASGKPIQARTESTNAARIVGSFIMVGLAGLFARWVKRRISGKLNMAARDVYLSARGIFGPNGQPIVERGGGAPHGGAGPHVPGEPEVKPAGRFARWKAKLAPAGRFFGSIYGIEAAETLATETGEGVKAVAGKGRWFAPGSGLRMAGSFVARGIVGYIGGAVINAVVTALPDFAGKDSIESLINWSSIGLSIFAPQLLSGIMGRFGGMLKGSGIFTKLFSGFGQTLTKGAITGGQEAGLLARLFSPGATMLGTAGKLLGRGLVGFIGGKILTGVLKFLPDFAGKDTLEEVLPWASMGLSMFGPQILRGITKVVGGMFGRAVTAAAAEAAAAEGGAAIVGAAGAGGMGLAAIIGMTMPEVAAIVVAAILAKEGLTSFGQWFTQWISGRTNKEEAEHQAKLKSAYDKLAEEEKTKTMTPAEHRRRWQELKDEALKDEAKKKDVQTTDKDAPVDQDAIQGMYAQLPGMLAAGMRIDPLGSSGGADRYDAFAKAIVDVQNDTAKNYLTAPIDAQTDNFETLNQRLLDTMALISIDQEKRAKAPDPNLDIEIQKAQLEQLQLQNALIARGNTLQQDANRVSPWQ